MIPAHKPFELFGQSDNRSISNTSAFGKRLISSFRVHFAPLRGVGNDDAEGQGRGRL
jgi:hypothetical protein